MSIASDCGACMVGNHTLHDRNHGIREGVIGGTYCDCSGDCAERARARGEELRALLTAAPEATDPTEQTANLTGWHRLDALATDPTPGEGILYMGAPLPMTVLNEAYRMHDLWLRSRPTPGEGLSEADDNWFRNQCWTCKGSGCNRCEAVRDRVERIVAARLAARDDEVEGLRRERDDWRLTEAVLRGEIRRAESAIDIFDRTLARAEAAEAEVEGLNADVESLTDDVTALRIESAQRAAKVADLRAKVERVEALAKEHAHCSGCPTPWWLAAELGESTNG